ncbi:hypothetical protein LFM09_28940 [Lentzea alba]|uniref:hypothetical protein n=1 Tax=Lentzea alba TaxID=2714351 RepID=UPI0039BF3D2F
MRFGDVDLGDWHALPPEELAKRPDLVHGQPAGDAAAKALTYARLTGQVGYDEIGFRSMAASPVKGYFPLQTFAQARLDAERERRRRAPADLDLLLTQTRKLRHRPIGLPEGRISFTIQDDLLNLTPVAEPGETGDGLVWSYSRGAPPEAFLGMTDDRDEPLIMTQYSPQNVPATYWLPLPALIAHGRFGRMQDISADLVPRTSPGNHYCFVSHRWLTPTAPDPDGDQARLLGWQLAAAMCEAVYVAHERGLHTPRKISKLGQQAFGAYGSDLAESLIVNVLRYALDPAGLDAVRAEIDSLQKETGDRGVPAGLTDTGLRRLREIVDAHPLLRSLLTRVHVWYDYSCMPQEPRTPEEQAVFEEGLTHLEIHQLLSRTAILLDDADDYLTRAWCTLEALTADAARSFDLLVGADRSTVHAGRTEQHLGNLLQDRPHVVWRGLLDTEVFGVQTPLECLRRLDLAATDGHDLPAIYRALCRLGMPTKIHIDDSEILTGVFPLPLAEAGRTVFVPTSGDKVRTGAHRGFGTTTLDWTGVLRLDERRGGNVPASFVETGSGGLGHAVVVGSCEGEAALIADWTLARLDELGRAVGSPVGSLSWLATDIAPVGHFADGDLRTKGIDARTWAVIASSARFANCPMTTAIINAITAAGVPYVTIAVDESADNVARYARPEQVNSDQARRADARAGAARWRGGLFRAHLFAELSRVERA